MTDDQHRGAPGMPGAWQPTAPGEYEDATGFLELPEGLTEVPEGYDAAGSPLAAPGHGYVPPQIAVTQVPGDPAGPAGTDMWGGTDPTGGDRRFADPTDPGGVPGVPHAPLGGAGQEGQPGQPDRFDPFGRFVPSDGPGQPGHPGRPGQPEHPGQQDRTERLDQPGHPGQPGAMPSGGPDCPQPVHWPDPNALPTQGARQHPGGPGTGPSLQDPFAYDPGMTQVPGAQGDPGTDGTGGPWHFDDRPDAAGALGGHQDGPSADAAAAPGDAPGGWSIPLAQDDLPDESGEFTTSVLAAQWGGVPPATLPGGATAPWAAGAGAGTGGSWAAGQGAQQAREEPTRHEEGPQVHRMQQGVRAQRAGREPQEYPASPYPSEPDQQAAVPFQDAEPLQERSFQEPQAFQEPQSFQGRSLQEQEEALPEAALQGNALQEESLQDEPWQGDVRQGDVRQGDPWQEGRLPDGVPDGVPGGVPGGPAPDGLPGGLQGDGTPGAAPGPDRVRFAGDDGDQESFGAGPEGPGADDDLYMGPVPGPPGAPPAPEAPDAPGAHPDEGPHLAQAAAGTVPPQAPRKRRPNRRPLQDTRVQEPLPEELPEPSRPFEGAAQEPPGLRDAPAPPDAPDAPDTPDAALAELPEPVFPEPVSPEPVFPEPVSPEPASPGAASPAAFPEAPSVPSPRAEPAPRADQPPQQPAEATEPTDQAGPTGLTDLPGRIGRTAPADPEDPHDLHAHQADRAPQDHPDHHPPADGPTADDPTADGPSEGHQDRRVHHPGEPPRSDQPDQHARPPLTSPDEDPPIADDEHPLVSYVLRVNGTDRPVTDAWIGESLLYVLRERLGLAGAKDGCSQGECGACNVQVDGRLVASCLVPAAGTAGSEVRTVEGLAEDGRPSDVQRALAECGAVQCGFCVPGMAMTVHDLLEGNPAPSDLEARQALAGNLCRCSAYNGVLDAVRRVVGERRAGAVEAAAEFGQGSGQRAGEDARVRVPQQAGPDAAGAHPSGAYPARTTQAPYRDAAPHGDAAPHDRPDRPPYEENGHSPHAAGEPDRDDRGSGDEGYGDRYDEGYDPGHHPGQHPGHDAGYQDAYDDGYDGYDDGGRA